MFSTPKVHDWRAILGHVGGENKKKLNGQFFFLVGPDFSTSEDSSIVEYKAHARKTKNVPHIVSLILIYSFSLILETFSRQHSCRMFQWKGK